MNNISSMKADTGLSTTGSKVDKKKQIEHKRKSLFDMIKSANKTDNTQSTQTELMKAMKELIATKKAMDAEIQPSKAKFS